MAVFHKDLIGALQDHAALDSALPNGGKPLAEGANRGRIGVDRALGEGFDHDPHPGTDRELLGNTNQVLGLDSGLETELGHMKGLAKWGG